jgi:hypothetical protein
MSFKKYLKSRRTAFYAQGDFVADALLDPNFPDPRTWKEFQAYVTECGSGHQRMAAARSVWRQYLLVRDEG